MIVKNNKGPKGSFQRLISSKIMHISKEKERRKRKNEEEERKRAEKGNGFTLSFYTAYVVAQKAA